MTYLVSDHVSLFCLVPRDKFQTSRNPIVFKHRIISEKSMNVFNELLKSKENDHILNR